MVLRFDMKRRAAKQKINLVNWHQKEQVPARTVSRASGELDLVSP
jgi:hypothetical protein